MSADAMIDELLHPLHGVERGLMSSDQGRRPMKHTRNGVVARRAWNLGIEMPRRSLAERLWAKVDRRGPDECWPWLAGTTRGYGYLRAGGLGRMIYAHRAAWEVANGCTIPAGMVACHTCDNPICCNPTHLWIGTVGDNNRDMTAKGRNWQQRKTHCAQGHEYTEENTRRNNGRRICGTCKRAHYAIGRTA